MKLSTAITERLIAPSILRPTKLGKGIIDWGLTYVWICAKCKAPVNLVHGKLYWACNCNK